MYTQDANHDIAADNRSLVVATANLLQRFNIEMEPAPLAKLLTQHEGQVDWWRVAEYFADVEVAEISNENDWPETQNAIIRFNRLDQEAAGMTDHYCVVADPKLHSIIDSLDGKIKSGSTYGDPTGWASYELDADPDTTEEDLKAAAVHSAKERLYTTLSGENIWDIARKLRLPASELAEHNEIADPRAVLPTGTVLHLPLPVGQTEEEHIKYEILASPLDMHVAKESGTKKFLFGNAKEWKDLSNAGPHYAENANVVIYAIAHVTIEGTEAAYYMDAHAVGNYALTGRVSYTAGFNWSDLADGHVARTKPTVPAIPLEQQKAIEIEILKTIAELETPKPLEALPEPEALIIQTTSAAKASYKPFNDDRSPISFVANETMLIQEIDGRREPREIKAGQAVKLVGHFWIGDEEYGRPAGSSDTGYWYCFPLDKMSLEDELYTYAMTLPEKAAMHHSLSLQERGVVWLSRGLSQYVKLTDFVTNKTKTRR